MFSLLVTTAYAQDQAALSGLKELKIAFDVTTGTSDVLVRELDVIDETRQSLMKQGIKPSIVIGSVVERLKLVQTDQSKIKPEDALTPRKSRRRSTHCTQRKGLGDRTVLHCLSSLRHQPRRCRPRHNGSRQWLDPWQHIRPKDTPTSRLTNDRRSLTSSHMVVKSRRND